MVIFKFSLTDEDAARIYNLRDEAGATELTAAEYAARMLSREARRLHPEKVEYTDGGERILRKGVKK